MILVIGEALVDLVVEDDGGIVAALGGGPFNAARAAARMGADVDFAGSLSSDRFGREHRDALVADGVGRELVSELDMPSTLAMAFVDPSGVAEYAFYLGGTAASSYDPSVLAETAHAMVLTGGLALSIDPLADRVVAVLERVGSTAVVMVDLNCRPGAVTDRATYAARLERVASTAAIVKASEEDLEFLAPGIPAEATARSLLDRGAAAVLVTRGADPTSVLTPTASELLAVARPPGPVVDTIGAGDTFCGALLAHLDAAAVGVGELRGPRGHEHLVGAVRTALVAASIVVTRRGADPPLAAEVDTLRD